MAQQAEDPRIVAGTEALRSVFGARLRAVLVVGAALDPTRADRTQHPMLLCIADGVSSADLIGVADGAGKEMKRGLRIRVLTAQELETSCDAFALEVAEWKARHLVLVGSDMLGPLKIERAHLRLAIERRLRGLGRQVRNRVLMTVATGDAMSRSGRLKQAEGSVRDALNALVTVSRHALAMVGDEVPGSRAGVLAAVAANAGLAPRTVDELTTMLAQKGDVLEELDVLLPAIDGVAGWVDQLVY